MGPDSPSHIAMTGHDFSPEDIQDLLGGYEPHHHDNHFPGSSASSLQQDNDFASDHKVAAQTERKRSREKQRRLDFNRQFSELTAALRRIEGDSEGNTAGSIYSGSITNRSDLIARTISLLNSLHESNKRRKTENEKLQEELERAKKAGEETAAKLKESMMAPQNVGSGKVMMMVPMMIGAGGDATVMSHAAAGMPYGAAQMAPFWMPPAPGSAQAPEHIAGVAGASASAKTSQDPPQQPPAPAMPFMMPPPWMMQNMMMMPTVAPMAPVASTSAGSASSNGDDQKKNAATGSPVGGNLAHCA
jgi:hypothetical protein